jgi:hypothetical protein
MLLNVAQADAKELAPRKASLAEGGMTTNWLKKFEVVLCNVIFQMCVDFKLFETFHFHDDGGKNLL